jgi:Ca2+-binding EF-hand superfamily protein
MMAFSRGNRADLEAITDYAEATNIKNVFADLTQQLCKDKPEDPVAYLIEMLTQNPVKIRPVPPRNLRSQIEKLFKDADLDGNGYLSRNEFKLVFAGLRETLKLSNKDIKKIMAEADENDDGLVSYEEFLPIAMDVIDACYNQMEIKEGEWVAEEEAQEAADGFLRGMSEEELGEVLKSAFTTADADGSGFLDRTEFKKVITECDLGFTRKEINILMSEVDVDGDNRISYEEFAPLCYSMLVQMVSKDLMTDAPEGQQDLEENLNGIFAAAGDKKGRISHSAAIAALLQEDLGLNRINASSCLGEVEQDKHGLLDPEEAARAAATAIFTFWQRWGWA